ncbi:hypothetical protein CW304_01285 [Bacillus sp. UFRGS-B20]|nr:hypothetical protein CW304_01285 [Bacillus sp. UFRGS-B20]
MIHRIHTCNIILKDNIIAKHPPTKKTPKAVSNNLPYSCSTALIQILRNQISYRQTTIKIGTLIISVQSFLAYNLTSSA